MASGDSLLEFFPGGYEPPTSNYATYDTRNQHPCLDFDPDTDETAMWRAIMPQSYADGGITAYIHYATTTAVTGAVVWDAAFERIGAEGQDIDTDGFAAVQSVTSTVPATCGHAKVPTIAFTDGAEMDSVVAGDLFRVKVTRDADNGSDTAEGDAELLGLELRET